MPTTHVIRLAGLRSRLPDGTKTILPTLWSIRKRILPNRSPYILHLKEEVLRRISIIVCLKCLPLKLIILLPLTIQPDVDYIRQHDLCDRTLSQSCQYGNKRKKVRNGRWYNCEQCGIHAQRDLYSAFLARFVQENKLDRSQALCAWPGSGILLEQAVSSLKETTSSKTRLASFGLGRSQSCLSVKKESVSSEALDVVATA